MTNWEKVSNIMIKRFNSALTYNKTYLKVEHKRKLSMLLCTSNIV